MGWAGRTGGENETTTIFAVHHRPVGSKKEPEKHSEWIIPKANRRVPQSIPPTTTTKPRTLHCSIRWSLGLFLCCALVYIFFILFVYNPKVTSHHAARDERWDASVSENDCTERTVDPFRYRGLRLHKDLKGTNAFLFKELRQIDTFRKPNDRSDCGNHASRKQLIVGRWGGSEQVLMDVAELPSIHSIPMEHVRNAGYYFLKQTNESTLSEQRRLVQVWGRQRQEAYAVMNAFGVFDWDHRPEQIRGIERYAPNTAWLHSSAFYPPCLPISNASSNDLPWTESLRNKTILIVHPFIDTIQQQIPKLPEIWSKANVTGAPSSCLPLDATSAMKFVRARLPVARPTQSWLDVLAEMQEEIAAVAPFDVALLACGGYGLPLLAYIAALPFRPSGIYVGGALQLYFGIHGARWYSDDAGYRGWRHLYTDAWTWPLETDVAFSTVKGLENAAYVNH